jgi:hypothetical protein
MRLEEGEKELEGLMNVYKIMAASNESLKESLAPADENCRLFLLKLQKHMN